MRKMMKQLGHTAARWGLLVMGAVLFNCAMAGLAAARGPHGTPEIDPGSIGSAITLFIGGAMYLTSRQRAK